MEVLVRDAVVADAEAVAAIGKVAFPGPPPRTHAFSSPSATAVSSATSTLTAKTPREKDLFFGALAAAARARAEQEGVAVEVEVQPGHAAELIVRFARERAADLIVLGHRGHFVRDHLLGSTADRVAEHADCPVMIVR